LKRRSIEEISEEINSYVKMNVIRENTCDKYASLALLKACDKVEDAQKSSLQPVLVVHSSPNMEEDVLVLHFRFVCGYYNLWDVNKDPHVLVGDYITIEDEVTTAKITRERGLEIVRKMRNAVGPIEKILTI